MVFIPKVLYIREMGMVSIILPVRQIIKKAFKCFVVAVTLSDSNSSSSNVIKNWSSNS